MQTCYCTCIHVQLQLILLTDAVMCSLGKSNNNINKYKYAPKTMTRQLKTAYSRCQIAKLMSVFIFKF